MCGNVVVKLGAGDVGRAKFVACDVARSGWGHV